MLGYTSRWNALLRSCIWRAEDSGTCSDGFGSLNKTTGTISFGSCGRKLQTQCCMRLSLQSTMRHFRHGHGATVADVTQIGLSCCRCLLAFSTSGRAEYQSVTACRHARNGRHSLSFHAIQITFSVSISLMGGYRDQSATTSWIRRRFHFGAKMIPSFAAANRAPATLA